MIFADGIPSSLTLESDQKMSSVKEDERRQLNIHTAQPIFQLKLNYVD